MTVERRRPATTWRTACRRASARRVAPCGIHWFPPSSASADRTARARCRQRDLRHRRAARRGRRPARRRGRTVAMTTISTTNMWMTTSAGAGSDDSGCVPGGGGGRGVGRNTFLFEPVIQPMPSGARTRRRTSWCRTQFISGLNAVELEEEIVVAGRRRRRHGRAGLDRDVDARARAWSSSSRASRGGRAGPRAASPSASSSAASSRAPTARAMLVRSPW